MEAAFKHRYFGGVNLIFFGDFWQLRPTGQIALMSDPRAEKAQEFETAQQIMSCFWCTHDMPHDQLALQKWSSGERLMHLDTNERSGADKGFGGVLEACREGNLGEDDYNFIHGYPTRAPIRFWYHRRKGRILSA